MRKVRLSALAESDLLDIWRYSFEQWDKAQADKYLDELDQGIQRLARDPETGAKRDDLRDGYRVLFLNRRAIYYTFTDSAIRVVRVLHSQMDPERHL